MKKIAVLLVCLMLVACGATPTATPVERSAGKTATPTATVTRSDTLSVNTVWQGRVTGMVGGSTTIYRVVESITNKDYTLNATMVSGNVTVGSDVRWYFLGSALVIEKK